MIIFLNFALPKAGSQRQGPRAPCDWWGHFVRWEFSKS